MTTELTCVYFYWQGVFNVQLLFVLGTKGSTSQFEACQLKKVGYQPQLKQLVDV